jgi:hypothetical protein
VEREGPAMCYALLLSTTSREDLSHYDSEEIRFNRSIAKHLPVDRLLYPKRWYVGSRIALVRELLAQGEHVDCIDAWEGNSEMPFARLPVNLGQIRDEEFRFFENHHFDFSASP